MKTVVISGGTGSIGKGIAKALINHNYQVVLIGRDIKKLRQVREELCNNNAVFIHQIDITDEQQVISAVTDIETKHKVYGLINAAGNSEPCDFLSSLDKDWFNAIQIKLLGVVRMTREFSKAMIQNSGNDKGRVIIINGTFSYDPHPDFIVASTINSALAGFAKASAKYLGANNIRLNIINPWITETESWYETAKILANDKVTSTETLNDYFKQLNPLKKFASIDDINNAVLFLLSSQSIYINGATINIDGGITTGF